MIFPEREDFSTCTTQTCNCARMVIKRTLTAEDAEVSVEVAEDGQLQEMRKHFMITAA